MRESGHYVTRGFAIVTASALGFGIAGGVIGSTLGRVAPRYHRAVFRGGVPDFDPVQVGLGLDITQGLIVGSVVAPAVAVSR